MFLGLTAQERLGVKFPWATRQVFIRTRGKVHYLWRAVDQHGVLLDIPVQSLRNAKAAKRSDTVGEFGSLGWSGGVE